MPANTSASLSDSDSYNYAIFEAMPGNSILVKPDAPHFTIVAVTVGMLERCGLPKEQLLGKHFFEPFPANPLNPDDPNATGQNITLASFKEVIKQKQLHQLPVLRYDLEGPGGHFIELYWKVYNKPVLDEKGEVIYIIHTSEDITAKIKADQREEKIKGIELAHGLFMQAPAVIGIVRGKDHVLELANETALQLWGKSADIIGKPLLEALPELNGQLAFDKIDQVYRTGQPHQAQEVPITTVKEGGKVMHYFDVYYQPYHEEGSTAVSGVFTLSNDVTEKVLAKKVFAESEQSLRLAIEIGELGIFKVDLSTQIATYSHAVTNWYGYTRLSRPLAEIISDIFPEDQPLVQANIKNTIEGGVHGKHDFIYRVINKKTGQLRYLRSIGQVHLQDGVAVNFSGILQDVSGQMAYHQQIAQSEQKLRNIILQAPVAMCVLRGPDFLVELANGKMFDLWGRGPEEVINQPLFVAMPETSGHDRQELLAKVFTTGEPFAAREYPVKFRRSGNVQQAFINFACEPVHETDGTISGIMAVATDVTEQVLARQKIEESEASFRTLIEEAPVATCVFVGRELRISMANQIMISYWGKDASVINKPLALALPELDGQPFLQLLDDVYTTGITYAATATKADLMVNGILSTFYFDFTFKPLRNSGGEVYAILEMAVDVTKAVITKRLLEKSEQNMRNMILQSPVAMCILRGPSYIVEIANERMLELWGKGAGELLNRPMFEGLPEAKEQGLEHLLLHVYTTGETHKAVEMPVNLTRNNKLETLYLNFVYEPFYDGGESIKGVIAVAVEVTEQVVARQKIEEIVTERTGKLADANITLSAMNTELKRSNANLEEFAHAASHDLKEPVRKIHYFTQHLKEQLSRQLTEPEARSFSRIENATERMGTLIDDLLLYSHVSQRPHDREVVDLNEKINRVLEDLELDIQERKAVLQVGKLPVVKGYRRQLQQLFQNLISNALKYSKSDVLPVITITATEVTENDKPYHLIKVADNGIGFEQHYEEKIFQMFSRLHGKNEYGGTGVGLSIVKKVVENHNGFIRVRSEPGKGSAFLVYLPTD